MLYTNRVKSPAPDYMRDTMVKNRCKNVNVAFQPRRDSNDDIYGMSFRDSIAPNKCSPRSTPITIVNTVSLRYSIQYKTLHYTQMSIEVYSSLVIKVLQYGLWTMD